MQINPLGHRNAVFEESAIYLKGCLSVKPIHWFFPFNHFTPSFTGHSQTKERKHDVLLLTCMRKRTVNTGTQSSVGLSSEEERRKGGMREAEKKTERGREEGELMKR